MNINKRHIFAIILISVMFLLSVFSIKNDSLTMDELSHLPAGYSYVSQKDMRINPEHPPLIKDLAGAPLLFLKNINFPYSHESWSEKVNGQWDFGNQFLFKIDNPADTMIFLGRMSMIFILMLFAGLLYFFMNKKFGSTAALLALFFFCFSPTILAHGKLITTDLGAAFGVFITIFTFFNFLEKPTKKNTFIAALALAFAQLTKFSNVLLFPFLILISLIWWFLNKNNFSELVKKVTLIFVLTFILILPIYFFHIFNYPIERQVSDTEFLLSTFGNEPLKNTIIWMAGNPILRSYAQYFLGLFMVMQRAVGGNTTFFMGEITNVGWIQYFPVVYLLKESLAFHILTLIAICFAIYKFIFRKKQDKLISELKNIIKTHFLEFSLLSYTLFYWFTALKSNLNIGVRHLLPAILLTYVLVAIGISKLLQNKNNLKIKILIISLLLSWQAASIFLTYPYLLSYYNEIGGGYRNGYNYVVDSNYDWGQGLKRLKNWTEENNVDKIYIDYFGGADLDYYFKDKHERWWGGRNPEEIEPGSYLAVSATFLQGGKGIPIKGFDRDPVGYYRWLNEEEIVARPDPSIFIFKIK